MREPALPHGELARLRRAVVRTTALRTVLGIGLAGVFVATLAVAVERDARPDPVLAAGRTGMIVLDMSASAGAHPDVGELLRRVAAADERTGVVVFSDVAYELVPPGTPGRDLAPMIRFFTPRRDGSVPANPWATSFSAGTSLTAGVDAAHAALRRDRVERGTILVASDLELFEGDAARLPPLLEALERDDVELRVLPLGAREEQRRFFARIAGADVFVTVDAALATARVDDPFRLDEEEMPWLFLALAVLLAALLAANERFCGRLRLSPPGSR